MTPEQLKTDVEEEIKVARNSLNTDKLDMSYGEIISMYQKEDLIINPEFQRLYRWDNEQKTKFIESLLLGIPIPPIFVAEDENGRWELVDGLQRISTVLSFFGELREAIPKNNNWKLEEGGILKKISGMMLSDLPPLFQRNIQRTYCRVEILKWDSEYDMRYELFSRLNTGGSTLTEQEIRNCIFRGYSSDFNDLLKRISDNTDFIELMHLSEQKVLESQLEELALRVFSLYDNWNNVSEKLSKHMTNFMEYAVKSGYDVTLEDKFNRAINLLSQLDFRIFRFNNGQLSTSLTDAIFVNIIMYIDKYEEKNKEDLLHIINELKMDDAFRKYTGSASGSKTRVKNRMKRANEIFKEYIIE